MVQHSQKNITQIMNAITHQTRDTILAIIPTTPALLFAEWNASSDSTVNLSFTTIAMIPCTMNQGKSHPITAFMIVEMYNACKPPSTSPSAISLYLAFRKLSTKTLPDIFITDFYHQIQYNIKSERMLICAAHQE
jgi:hypothetical protein